MASGREDYEGFGHFYTEGPYEQFLQDARLPAGLGWGMARLRSPAGAYPDPSLPEFSIQSTLRSSGPPCVWDLGTGRVSNRLTPGTTVISPPDTPCHYQIDDWFEITVLHIAKREVERLLAPIAPNFGGDFGKLHGPALRDPFLARMLERMWDEAASDNPLGRAFLESAMLALLLDIYMQSLGERNSLPDRVQGGLSPYRMRQLTAYIRDRLADDIGLQELADEVGLSSFHLLRAFRAETGLTPHRWITNERVERAKQLLAGTNFSVGDIARLTGFRSRQGLTSAFRASIGVPPQVFRRSLRK